MRVLVTTQLLPQGFEELKHIHEVVFPEKSIFSEDEVVAMLPTFDALLPTFAFKVNRRVIDAGRNLKIIANYGVGYNNIDVEYATQKGIVVTNTPNPVTEPTAEMTFALMLACARRIAECDRKLRQPDAIKWGVLENLGVSLYGKTLGIIGLGRIGKAVARRAVAFGMSVVYNNRHRLTEAKEQAVGASFLPLNELLQLSDVVSVNVPLTDETYHLLGKPQFDLMKPTSILVNTARGPIVDESALVEALASNKIRSAGLDVYEYEPQITKELFSIDNVVLAPHNGTATIDARIAMSEFACSCIIEFFKGNKNISVVNHII